MPNYFFPILAAFACAVCNGTAAVLQKISADKEKTVSSLDARLLWRLARDKPYAGGVALDILGWLLAIFAVQYLPLFLVEAIIAANIVVTALVERLFRRQKISPKSYLAISIIMVGIIILAIVSSPEKAEPISNTLRWLIVLVPMPIGIAGYVLAHGRNYMASIGLAILGGLAFGGTAVVGRIFKFSQPIWHTIYSPLIFALIASGTLGILLFSIALQRAQATVVNATMTASQTLIPAIIGITFLGDHARGGMWYFVILGVSLALGGVVSLALDMKTKNSTLRGA
jgi:drug/metabolite transporter (DMT)-like permease